MERKVYLMGKGLILLGAWAAFASVSTIVTNVGAAFDGETWAITRVGIGIVGVAGAALLLTGHNAGRTGWLAIAAWAVLQLPYYAGVDQENVTRQLVDGLLGASSQTTVNGEVTSAEAMGLNLVGVALVIWVMASRKRLDLWRRRAEPEIGSPASVQA